jgi:hypothetical protein
LEEAAVAQDSIKIRELAIEMVRFIEQVELIPRNL